MLFPELPAKASAPKRSCDPREAHSFCRCQPWYISVAFSLSSILYMSLRFHTVHFAARTRQYLFLETKRISAWQPYGCQKNVSVGASELLDWVQQLQRLRRLYSTDSRKAQESQLEAC